MNKERLHYITALNSLPGIGTRAIYNLKEHFKDFKDVFFAKAEDLASVEGISPKTAEDIIHFDLDAFISSEESAIRSEGASIITIEDDNYPAQLKNIYDPPYVLYVKGTLSREDIISVAIVGARKATNYGKLTAERLSADIARSGITIVSGLALGIDTVAHKAAIEAGGRTIAVMGCGIDINYPADNRGLKEKIAQNGAVISEFAFSVKPEKRNFPRRNRIISGLSLGTLVVEASEKSGSLITAGFAIEQGREVYAVPGNINMPGSAGCNKLIKLGAKLVEEVNDILDEIPYSLKERLLKQRKEFKVECKNVTLNEKEKYLLSVLKAEEMHIDEITRQTNIRSDQLLSMLTKLELLGVVKQLRGKMFVSMFKV